MTTKLPKRRVHHVPKGTPEFVGDSRRAIAEAARAGERWIDLNMLRTADGVLVNEHWRRPLDRGFEHMSLKQIDSRTQIGAIPWRYVQQFEAEHKGETYRIHKMRAQIAYALSLGVNVELEPKWAGATVADYRSLHADPKRVQVKAFAKYLPSLIQAKKAGFQTILLCHHPLIRIDAKWEPFIDYWRGKPWNKPRFTGGAR